MSDKYIRDPLVDLRADNERLRAERDELLLWKEGKKGVEEFFAERWAKEQAIMRAEKAEAEKADLSLRLEQMRGWLEKIIGWMEGGNEEANATADELRAFLSATPTGELAREVREVLTRLIDAAEAYSADQSQETDRRCGAVQPITVEEGEELNGAIAGARSLLAKLGGEG